MEGNTTDIIENYTINPNNSDLDRDIINIYSLFWKNHVSQVIYKYVCPIIVIVGILGNIMSFAVFSTRAMNGLVSSIFFRMLAIADTLFLCTFILMWFSEVVYYYQFQHSHIVACKIYYFLIYWTKDMPGWILSAVAVERAIGVSIPHHYKRLVTRKRAYILLLIIILTLLGINSCLFVLFTLTRYDEHNFHCKIPEDYKQYWHYLNMVVYCFFPFTTICTSNICVIYCVLRANYSRRMFKTTNQSMNHSINLTVILIIVSVVYLCCTLPIEAYYILVPFWYDPDMSYITISKLNLFFSFASFLVLLNSAVNFVMYCLSGPRFRQELLNMLCKSRPQAQ